MSRNYEQKLLQEIITGNYHRKLSASIYHHAKNESYLIWRIQNESLNYYLTEIRQYFDRQMQTV